MFTGLNHCSRHTLKWTLFTVFTGGPGSRKGRIIDDLVAMYGFTLLSAEELILERLPLKIEESNSNHKLDTTMAIQKILRVM